MTSHTKTMDEIMDEMQTARYRYGSFSSAHEALGVLVEEVAELVEAIHANNADAFRREAIQVSAVAARAAECSAIHSFRLRSGMIHGDEK